MIFFICDNSFPYMDIRYLKSFENYFLKSNSFPHISEVFIINNDIIK